MQNIQIIPYPCHCTWSRLLLIKKSIFRVKLRPYIYTGLLIYSTLIFFENADMSSCLGTHFYCLSSAFRGWALIIRYIKGGNINHVEGGEVSQMTTLLFNLIHQKCSRRRNGVKIIKNLFTWFMDNPLCKYENESSHWIWFEHI